MITICIPTLNRYDLLIRCIDTLVNGSKAPDKISIIDNGGNLSLNPGHYPETRLSIYKPGINLGVGPSWNHFINTEEYPMLIINDDLELGVDDVRNFAKSYDEQRGGLLYSSNSGLNMFSCFMPTKKLIQSVGLFDEKFYPAYFEDNDFFRRMELAKQKTWPVETNLNHVGSATLKAYDDQRQSRHHAEFNRNRDYYLKKWGGLPTEEVYTIPFDGKEHEM